VDVARAVELYAEGVPMRLIAHELGVAESTVSRKLRRAGVPTHRAGAKRAPVTDRDIVRLRMEGKLWREVAAEVGMTMSGVHARYRRMKLSGKL
jgi:IS30 family transposase